MSYKNSEVESSKLETQGKYYDEFLNMYIDIDPSGDSATAYNPPVREGGSESDENYSGNHHPNQPLSDPIYLLEHHGIEPEYLSRCFTEGRSLPFAIAHHDLSQDYSLLKSADSKKGFEGFLDELIEAIDEHCDSYGFMFTQDVFEDLGEYDHMQTAFVIPSLIEGRVPSLMPIMGLNGVFLCLNRLKYARENPGKFTCNSVMIGSDMPYDDEESGSIEEQLEDLGFAFSYTYCGHLSFNGLSSYLESDLNTAFQVFATEDDNDGDDMEFGVGYRHDVYAYQYASIYIEISLSGMQSKEYPNYKPDLLEPVFTRYNIKDVPPIWLSIILSKYIEDSYLSEVAEYASKYQDVFAFLIASCSGLSMEYFHSFKGRRSDFHELGIAKKREVLLKMAHLADEICLAMQGSSVTQMSPLHNLYESSYRG